jgi:hypothetical protein
MSPSSRTSISPAWTPARMSSRSDASRGGEGDGRGRRVEGHEQSIARRLHDRAVVARGSAAGGHVMPVEQRAPCLVAQIRPPNDNVCKHSGLLGIDFYGKRVRLSLHELA